MDNSKRAAKQRGMSLVELMVSMVVLLVGLIGSMSLVTLAMGGNGRSKQQSNSTVFSQMMAEKISSSKASLSPILTITDCAGNSNTVYTAAGGSPLSSSGEVDYTQAAVANYQMLYKDCGTNGRFTSYDVRWNIQQVTPYVKLLVVSSKLQNGGNDLKFFSLPVTVRTLIGQGT